MRPDIKRFDASAEYYFREGCFIIELANSVEDPHVSIARARVSPGATTRWHRLDGISERYVIMEGQGRVEVDGLPPSDVAAGDVVTIPPLVNQRISNTGAGDLIFLAICAPRFVEEAYRATKDAPS